MTNEIPRRRGTPAQRAIAAQAIRSIRRTTPTSGLRCLHLDPVGEGVVNSIIRAQVTAATREKVAA